MGAELVDSDVDRVSTFAPYKSSRRYSENSKFLEEAILLSRNGGSSP